MSERKSDAELAGLVCVSAQVITVMIEVLCFDLIAKLVINLTLERKNVISELQIHDLGLRLRFEDSP